VAILARSGRVLTMAGFRPGSGPHASCDGAQIPAPAVFRWLDVAGFWPCLDSDYRPLPDSDNWISNMRAKTKSLISENDLLFLDRKSFFKN
jgi:hypothetical protein